MPAMTETYSSSVRPEYLTDYHSHTLRDNLSTPPSTSSSDQTHRSILPTDYDDLSPLDALAAQGRLLNKRLTQHGGKTSLEPKEINTGLDKSVFPKFGSEESLDDHLYHGYERRDRLPERRKAGERDISTGARSPVDSLSMATLSLLSIPRPASPREQVRSASQASSILSFSSSSDESLTPTEELLPQIYQPPSQPPPRAPPRHDPPRLRPIIKTQQLPRPYPPARSPTPSNQQPSLENAPRSFSPQITNSLDRPRLPSPQVGRPTHTGRTPSINFSRPYSSRSSNYSDTSSAFEVDYFSGHKPTSSTLSIDDHLSVPQKSPATSLMSSPGLGEEDLKSLPRGRSTKRSPRPVDTGVFFHSKSMKSQNGAHRWPQTPVTPTPSSERKFFPSPPQPLTRMPDRPSTATSTGSRPATSGTSDSSPRLLPAQHPQARQSRAFNEARMSPAPRSRSQDSVKSRNFLMPPGSRDTMFSSPTQILNPTRAVTMSLVPVPADTISAEDHVNLGIKFHEQDLLPQSTHHFSLAAEMGSPTGMLLYSLSLRHGWGCASNPAKAVEWLHAAAESASAEVDANGVRRPIPGGEMLQFNSADGKRGGATLALAIYELGQSYMNGWGVAKDKHLALRCFEISANFGDTDGQCETAWCYLHGIGTKKNVRLAARYYRMAEKQGVKSVGLSWIWKDKYNEKEDSVKGRTSLFVQDDNATSKKGKKLFGRKNSA